jgi:SAM-dependent methyltransferase
MREVAGGAKPSPLLIDQLVRFEPIVRLICQVGGKTVLDVGSGSSGIVGLIPPGWVVTAVDSSFDDYGTARGPARGNAQRLVADARDLPFEDESFDVVIAIDLLEHLAPQDRHVAVDQIMRVARRRVVVACPAGGRALGTDHRLAEAYERRAQPLPGWLDEHLANGFPEPAELAEMLSEFGPVRLQRNENLWAHAGLMRLEAGRLGPLLSPRIAAVLAGSGRSLEGPAGWRRALISLLRGFDISPWYRTIAVADRAASRG